jgi:hypothetical protein
LVGLQKAAGARTAGMFASADGFFLRRFRRESLAGCAFACDAEATRGEALGLAASLAGTWTEGHSLSIFAGYFCIEEVKDVLTD